MVSAYANGCNSRMTRCAFSKPMLRYVKRGGWRGGGDSEAGPNKKSLSAISYLQRAEFVRALGDISLANYFFLAERSQSPPPGTIDFR